MGMFSDLNISRSRSEAIFSTKATKPSFALDSIFCMNRIERPLSWLHDIVIAKARAVNSSFFSLLYVSVRKRCLKLVDISSLGFNRKGPEGTNKLSFLTLFKSSEIWKFSA